MKKLGQRFSLRVFDNFVMYFFGQHKSQKKTTLSVSFTCLIKPMLVMV